MKQFWLRMQRVMAAKSHANIDRLEHPTEMVDQLLREKVSAVAAAKLALARAKVWQQQLQQQQQQMHSDVERYQTLACDALRDNREDMARTVLIKKHESQQRLADQERQLQQAASMRQRQEDQLDKLQQALRELRNRREGLIQRHLFTHAAASMMQHEGAFAEPADVVLERIEAKVSYREAEVEAYLDSDQPSQDQELQQYQSNRDLERELAQLKQSLNAS